MNDDFVAGLGIFAAHPLIGIGGIAKTSGEEINGEVAKHLDYAVTAKLDAQGIHALKGYLDSVDYRLGRPELFPVQFKDKDIMLFWYSSHDFVRIDGEKLMEVLKPYALSQEQAAQTNLLFGLIFMKYRSVSMS